MPRCKWGRPAYYEKYPDLVPCIEKFIENNSAAAHLRRRDDVMYSNGVTIKDIKMHVKKSIGLSVSKDTIHRLLKPRRQGSITSKYFKSLVNARVPPKNNSGERRTHVDFHFTSAQINYLNQMATLFSNNTIKLSVNNKNKVEVSNPAVNRRIQLRTFHLIPDAPIYNDHDFPYRNSKLTPAGYQILKNKPIRSRSLSPTKSRFKVRNKRSLSENDGCVRYLKKWVELCPDKRGCEKIKWPKSGPLTVRINPSRVIESTNLMHVNFLSEFLCKQIVPVYNAVLICDGGPDWSIKGVLNLMSVGYLWRNLKLDTLILQCYAPGHSRFNPIERSWSQLTKWLTSVVLPVDICGETPKENDEEGWLKILDMATSLCARFWDGKKYNGFTVNALPFLSNNRNIDELKSYHALLNEFINASAKKIRNSPEFLKLQVDYQFFVNVCNRKMYQLEFMRCKNKVCSHCAQLPNRENEFLKAIYKFGGTIPLPEKSEIHLGHYKTFLDLLRSINIKDYSKIKKINDSDHAICKFG